jgi:hypothetical protein
LESQRRPTVADLEEDAKYADRVDYVPRRAWRDERNWTEPRAPRIFAILKRNSTAVTLATAAFLGSIFYLLVQRSIERRQEGHMRIEKLKMRCEDMVRQTLTTHSATAAARARSERHRVASSGSFFSSLLSAAWPDGPR